MLCLLRSGSMSVEAAGVTTRIAFDAAPRHSDVARGSRPEGNDREGATPEATPAESGQVPNRPLETGRYFLRDKATVALRGV